MATGEGSDHILEKIMIPCVQMNLFHKCNTLNKMLVKFQDYILITTLSNHTFFFNVHCSGRRDLRLLIFNQFLHFGKHGAEWGKNDFSQNFFSKNSNKELSGDEGNQGQGQAVE